MDIGTAIPATPPIVDASGTVIGDAACRRCGYNLRGLNQFGLCPECATPVGLSIQGDLLRYSDPQWLDTLARGVSCILWGILVAIVIGLVGGVIFGEIPGANQVIELLAGLLSVYGAWLLTTPDPSGIGEDPNVTARKIVRFALLVGLASNVIEIFDELLSLPPAAHMLLRVLVLLVGLVGVVGEFAKLRYLQRLALRIPDETLAGRARFLFWAYGSSLGGTVVFGGLFAIMGGPRAGGAAVLLGVLLGICALALIVFAIMSLFLLYRMGKAFRAQATLARTTWAAQLPQPPAPSMPVGQ